MERPAVHPTSFSPQMAQPYSRNSTRRNGHEIAFFSCFLWDHQFWAQKKINSQIEKSVYAYLVIMLSNVYDSVGDIRSWKVLNIEK